MAGRFGTKGNRRDFFLYLDDAGKFFGLRYPSPNAVDPFSGGGPALAAGYKICYEKGEFRDAIAEPCRNVIPCSNSESRKRFRKDIKKALSMLQSRGIIEGMKNDLFDRKACAKTERGK